MSSQSSDFATIPFSITHPQQTLRLIELPPDLVELLTSSDRPTSLQLKSSYSNIEHVSNGSSTSTKPSASKEGFLHLCSYDKVWAVRQVSTSNSVYITAPDHRSRSSPAGEGPSGSSFAGTNGVEVNEESTEVSIQPQRSENLLQGVGQGITAVAHVSNVLELIETKTTLEEVEDTLRSYVPILQYLGRDDSSNITSSETYRHSNANLPMSSRDGSNQTRIYTLKQAYNDLAAPNKLITQAINNLLIFEHEGTCHLPSPELQLKAWTALVQIATIAGTKFNGAYAVNFEPLVSTVGEDDDAAYADLLKPIIRSLLTIEEESLHHQQDSNSHYKASSDNRSPSMSLFGHLDQSKTVPYIGRLLLQSTDPAEGMKLTNFTEQWTNLVPSTWIANCRIEVLQGRYEIRRRLGKVAKRKQTAFEDDDEDMQDGNDSPDHAAVEEEEEYIYPLATSLHGSAGLVPIRGTGDGGAQGESKSTAPASAANTGKRKWHEKFAAQRKR